jgi:UDP-N-acetylglucosamine 2-epimerase (non-hydrolysing)
MHKTIHLVAAARPNFMKVAPLYHALSKESWCSVKIVHTGQHYDPNMSDAFFRDLRIPKPDFHLEIGSGSHAQQTGGVMIAYEKICMEHRPDWIIVAGDVNSTVACAMVGTKLWIPVVHLEAGLRSNDRHMPEEINRLATDAISDVLWTPSPDADENLKREGTDPSRIDQVGNIMIDSYEMLREQIAAEGSRARLIPTWNKYAVVTLHRPSNVDERGALTIIVDQLIAGAHDLPLIFPVHPRTRNKLKEFGLLDKLGANKNICLTEPLGYIEFMNLVIGASAVITDSGGVQEETTYLRIPCLTLRENTERPTTLTQGSNRLVKPANIAAALKDALDGSWKGATPPANWDGHTADRCVAALKKRIGISV